ncbi:regulator of replication initiation timing [Catenulispora sp. MAP12-49]|uniref:hypothetical protein n=1 Tax=unclassified Catenulispora TaxID=414885 RepID=UPI003515138E
MVLGVGPLAYRSVLRAPSADSAFRDVRRVTEAWLAGKFDLAPPPASGVHRLDAESMLTVQAAYVHGDEQAIRLQLREDRLQATWRTTITAVTPPGPGALIAVSLEVFSNSGTVPAARPKLIRDLVQALRPVDGPAPLTTHAQPVAPEGVHELIDVLCDPGRRMPVVLVARPLQPSLEWNRRLQTIERECAGSASLYMLPDIKAVDSFRAAIGEHHRVAPGAVRTYLTEVDPAWRGDAPRHRFLPVARLSDPADQAWRGVYRTVQRLSTGAVMPEALRNVMFPDDDGRRRSAERQAALAVEVSSAELAQLTRENQDLRELLAGADEDLQEAARNEELSKQTIASQEEQLLDAWATMEDDADTAQRALDEAERARAESDILRRRLREAGQYEDAVVAEPPAGVPNSFEELWERLEWLDGILVTADKETALSLDESERARVWAAKAWNGLRALDSYAQAAKDGFNGGFYEHCKQGRAGTVTWPLKQVAMAESETTMNKWGFERVFAVPPEVDGSGRSEMQAHLKLEGKGSACPRIHFFDDAKGATGQIVVGYIGPHLHNTKTN